MRIESANKNAQERLEVGQDIVAQQLVLELAHEEATNQEPVERGLYEKLCSKFHSMQNPTFHGIKRLPHYSHQEFLLTFHETMFRRHNERFVLNTRINTTLY